MVKWFPSSVSKFWWYWVADVKLERPHVSWWNTDARLKMKQNCKICMEHCSLTSYLSCTEPSQKEGLQKVSRKFNPVRYWVSAVAADAFFTGFSSALFLCLVFTLLLLSIAQLFCQVFQCYCSTERVHWLKNKCILHVSESNATCHHQTQTR